MEKLAKQAIYLSMGIGITFFAIFMLLVIPVLINDVGRQWDEAFNESGLNKPDYDLQKQRYMEHPVYVAFFEKYPDGGEYFRQRNNGGAEMQLTAMNFETFTKLEVEMNGNPDARELYLQARCENDQANFHMRVVGTIVEKFIKESNCLGEGHTGAISPLVDDQGNPVPVPDVPTVVLD